jgi:hypothetical protein
MSLPDRFSLTICTAMENFSRKCSAYCPKAQRRRGRCPKSHMVVTKENRLPWRISSISTRSLSIQSSLIESLGHFTGRSTWTVFQ